MIYESDEECKTKHQGDEKKNHSTFASDSEERDFINDDNVTDDELSTGLSINEVINDMLKHIPSCRRKTPHYSKFNCS